MIKANIKEIATKNGVTTAYQLQKLMNLQPSQAAKLYRNDLKMIGFDTLNELCKVFKCLPSDILVYTADDGTAQESNTKLSKAISNNAQSSISKMHNMSDGNITTSAIRKRAAPVVDLPDLGTGDKWIETSEIAARLDKPESTIRYFYNHQGLKSEKFGKKRFVKESDLTEFLTNRK
jgi:DNA-binding Xre family transcriptional regulator